MIRTTLAAAMLLAAISSATPAVAQSEQERIDARYDRALAAGYKALMLCSAIAHAEANGASRTVESVIAWELAGIQAPLADIVPDLAHEIVRHDNGTVERVNVAWDEQTAPRSAIHLDEDRGCTLNPIAGPASFYGRPANPPSSRPADTMAVRKPSARLRPVTDAALASTYGARSRTTAVVVRQGGKVIGEAYTDGFTPATPQRTWSVAKSIAATLVGAAVHRGEIATDASAGLGYAEGDPRRAITVDHLLRMASGRYSDTPGSRTDPLYWGGASVDEVALDWPLIEAAGKTHRYANNDTLGAVAAIAPTFAQHPPAGFFAKLGMTHTVAEIDWRGNYVLSSQVWSTARDLARFGQLYLDGGKLASGERILPEGWGTYVSAPAGPQPEGAFGYGAGFWLMNRSEGVPSDAFAAFGNRGQYVVIVPSRDLVIVRRGEDPVGAGFDIAAFTRDVLAAVPKG